jgi:surface protein
VLGLGNTLSGGIVPAVAAASANFTFTVNTENAGSATKTFVLPLLENGTIDFDVDWGDSSTDTITAYDQSEVTHVYEATGTYTINITNEVRGWKFNDGGDELKILNISSWGEFNFTERDTFRGCANLTSSATNVPTVSQQYFQRQFMFATSFNGDVSNWDISGSTYTNMCFRGATAFTGIGISTWDMSNVIDISYMFYSATSFDQDLSDWDIGQVSNMSNVLRSVTLSTANYDATLIGWAAQSVQASQSPHFGSSKYTWGGAAAAARASLISEDSWTITDGGIA